MVFYTISIKLIGRWKAGRSAEVGQATGHWWILDEKTDKAWGLYFISQDERGGYPLMVCQNTMDHLCCIILGILGHHKR